MRRAARPGLRFLPCLLASALPAFSQGSSAVSWGCGPGTVGRASSVDTARQVSLGASQLSSSSLTDPSPLCWGVPVTELGTNGPISECECVVPGFTMSSTWGEENSFSLSANPSCSAQL